MYGRVAANNFQVSVTVIMVQFIRAGGGFWAGFISTMSRWSQLLSSEAAAWCQFLHNPLT